MPEPIGGYFGLEPRGGSWTPPPGALALNLARRALEYVLRARRPRALLLPAWLCSVMLEPVRATGVALRPYHVGADFAGPADLAPGPDELLLCVNYFGVRDRQVQALGARWGGRLIVDGSQAFFGPLPAGAHVITSPRKFFGVPDGAFLWTDGRLDEPLDEDDSTGRDTHLRGRLQDGPQAHYPEFQRRERALSSVPLRRMSAATADHLAHVDVAGARARRLDNFRRLHQLLGDRNELPLAEEDTAGPLAYPFLGGGPGLRRRLIGEGIFVPTYWPELTDDRLDPTERRFRDRLLPLPLDQRYGPGHMERIAAAVLRLADDEGTR